MGFKAKCRGIMTYFFSSLSRREPVGASRSRNRLEKRGKVICETERMRLAELDFGLSDSSRAGDIVTDRKDSAHASKPPSDNGCSGDALNGLLRNMIERIESISDEQGDVSKAQPEASHSMSSSSSPSDSSISRGEMVPKPLDWGKQSHSSIGSITPPKTYRAKEKQLDSSIARAEELFDLISREKQNQRANASPRNPHSLSTSLPSSNPSPTDRQSTHTKSTTGVSRWPATNSRFKELFDDSHAPIPTPTHSRAPSPASARRENPKLRLARLRREADSRSGSSANSLYSASGALWWSGCSTPSPLSRAGSETSGSARSDDKGRMREGICEMLVGAHCANSARTGLPRWGGVEVRRTRKGEGLSAQAREKSTREGNSADTQALASGTDRTLDHEKKAFGEKSIGNRGVSA